MAKKVEKKEVKKEIKLQPIRVNTCKLKIKGKTALVQNRFSDETKDQILAKQTGTSKSNKKRVRDIEEEIVSSIHFIDQKKGLIGTPAEGFKKGMMESTSFVGDKFFSKKLIMGAVRIINAQNGLVPIKFKKQTVLEHNVAHNVLFNPQFHDWETELHIQYDANNISPQDIALLLNYAGFYVGIGMWRPKCRDGGSGNFGMYEVVAK